MVLHIRDTRAQVGLVELVWHAEAEGAKLAPLLHDCVHEAERVQHRLPLRMGDHVEHVLIDPGVRRLEPRAHAGGGLVGDLDGHLEQADWEVDVRLGGDPQLEVRVDVLHLDHALLNLAHEGETQVAVLQHHPRALLSRYAYVWCAVGVGSERTELGKCVGRAGRGVGGSSR